MLTRLRATLAVVGVLFALGLLFIGGSNWVPRPWELTPDSARYLVYDFVLVKHRWFTASVMVIYGISVVVAFKQEFVGLLKIEGGKEFWVRLLLPSLLLALMALFWHS